MFFTSMVRTMQPSRTGISVLFCSVQLYRLVHFLDATKLN